MLRNAEDGVLSMVICLAIKYSYFDLDGAYFRRADGLGTRSVDDVLHEGEWKPYRGDCLRPALFGDQIEDPLKESPDVHA